MKKRLAIFGFVLVVLISVIGLRADFIDDNASNAPVVSRYGSKLFPNSGISFGTNPGDTSSDFIPCFTDVAVAVGDAVIISSATTYLVSVSETTTVGDTSFLGIAATATTKAGQIALIRTRGICRVNLPATGLTVAKNTLLVTAGVAGAVTGSGAVSGPNYLGLSRTALVGTSVETLTSGGGPVLIFQNGR